LTCKHSFRHTGWPETPETMDTQIKMLDNDIIWTNSCTGLEK